MIHDADCFLLFRIYSKKKRLLNIQEGTTKFVLKNIYVLQQIVSFVGDTLLYKGFALGIQSDLKQSKLAALSESQSQAGLHLFHF